MDKTWKAVERKFADYFGGVRVPVTGRQRGSAPDIQHEKFSFEVKHRKSLPAWLFDAMNQAEESRTDGQMALVVLHQKGQTCGESLTVMRASDILALYREIETLKGELEDADSALRYYGGG